MSYAPVLWKHINDIRTALIQTSNTTPDFLYPQNVTIKLFDPGGLIVGYRSRTMIQMVNSCIVSMHMNK